MEGPACRSRQEGDPASDSSLLAPPQAAPHSPATAWLWVDPFWAPSGGQRSSPLSTAPTSLGSTTIEGSRWPSRGPFSRAPTAACRKGGRGQDNTRSWVPTPSHTCPAFCPLGGLGAPCSVSRAGASMCVCMCMPAYPPEGSSPSCISPLGLEYSVPGVAALWGHHRTHLGSALRPISQTEA